MSEAYDVAVRSAKVNGGTLDITYEVTSGDQEGRVFTVSHRSWRANSNGMDEDATGNRDADYWDVPNPDETEELVRGVVDRVAGDPPVGAKTEALTRAIRGFPPVPVPVPFTHRFDTEKPPRVTLPSVKPVFELDFRENPLAMPLFSRYLASGRFWQDFGTFADETA